MAPSVSGLTLGGWSLKLSPSVIKHGNSFLCTCSLSILMMRMRIKVCSCLFLQVASNDGYVPMKRQLWKSCWGGRWMMMMRFCPNIEYLWTREAFKGGPFMHTRPTLTSNPDTIFNIYCELLKKHCITLNIPLYDFGGNLLDLISFPTGPKVEIWALESSHKRFWGWKDSIKRLRAIKRPPKSLLLGNMVSGIVLTTIFCLILIQFSSRFYIVSDLKYSNPIVVPLPGLVNDSLNRLRTPVVETWIMASEDAYSILSGNSNSDVVADAPDVQDI